MSRFVEVWKESETDREVVYLYGPDRKNTGTLKIDKVSGQITGTAIPGMESEDSWFFHGILANSIAEKMYEEGIYPENDRRIT